MLFFLSDDFAYHWLCILLLDTVGRIQIYWDPMTPLARCALGLKWSCLAPIQLPVCTYNFPGLSLFMWSFLSVPDSDYPQPTPCLCLVMELLCSCDPEEITAKDNHSHNGNQVLRFPFPSASNCRLISFKWNLGSPCYPARPILGVSTVTIPF